MDCHRQCCYNHGDKHMPSSKKLCCPSSSRHIVDTAVQRPREQDSVSNPINTITTLKAASTSKSWESEWCITHCLITRGHPFRTGLWVVSHHLPSVVHTTMYSALAYLTEAEPQKQLHLYSMHVLVTLPIRVERKEGGVSARVSPVVLAGRWSAWRPHPPLAT